MAVVVGKRHRGRPSEDVKHNHGFAGAGGGRFRGCDGGGR